MSHRPVTVRRVEPGRWLWTLTCHGWPPHIGFAPTMAAALALGLARLDEVRA